MGSGRDGVRDGGSEGWREGWREGGAWTGRRRLKNKIAEDVSRELGYSADALLELQPLKKRV